MPHKQSKNQPVNHPPHKPVRIQPRRWLIIHLAVLFAALVLFVVCRIYQCPVQLFLHIPCPACGITRAWLAALRLDFCAAFHYHPLFLPTPFAVLYYIHRDRIPPRFRRPRIENTVLITFAVLFFLFYILRLIGSEHGSFLLGL